MGKEPRHEHEWVALRAIEVSRTEETCNPQKCGVEGCPATRTVRYAPIAQGDKTIWEIHTAVTE